MLREDVLRGRALYNEGFSFSRDPWLLAITLARATDGRLAASRAIPDGLTDEAHTAAPAANRCVCLLAAFHPWQHDLQMV